MTIKIKMLLGEIEVTGDEQALNDLASVFMDSGNTLYKEGFRKLADSRYEDYCQIYDALKKADFYK